MIFAGGNGPLGIVAYPNEVNRTLTGHSATAHAFSGPIAGQYATGPIAGNYNPRFHGSPQELGAPISHTYGLGNIPNDIDLARYRDTWYQGVHHGWINGRDRFYPDGNLGNTYAAVRGIVGLADTEKSLEEIARSEKMKARMAIISAIAVSTVALITLIAYIKGK